MEEKAVSVVELKPGEKAEIYTLLSPGEGQEKGWGACDGHNNGRRCRGACRCDKRCIERLFEAIGLYKGQIIEVVENYGCGPVILKVEDGGKFLLGRRQASCIFVKKINNAKRWIRKNIIF